MSGKIASSGFPRREIGDDPCRGLSGVRAGGCERDQRTDAIESWRGRWMQTHTMPIPAREDEGQRLVWSQSDVVAIDLESSIWRGRNRT